MADLTPRAIDARALLDNPGYAVLLDILRSKKSGALADLLEGPWEKVLAARAKIEVIDGLVTELEAISRETETKKEKP